MKDISVLVDSVEIFPKCRFKVSLLFLCFFYCSITNAYNFLHGIVYSFEPGLVFDALISVCRRHKG